MDDRRVVDEHFRREQAERLKALEIVVNELRNEIREVKQDIAQIKMDILDLRYTLFGGPKQDDVGLLEKIRKIIYIAMGCWFVASSILFFAGRLISPIYDKLVADWAYNSVSERWMREQSRPKITRYIIKRPRADADSE